MEIIKFTFNPIQENTYLAVDDKKNAVIIDPGCYFEEERLVLKNYLSKNKITLKAILNTHAHLDHVMGNAFIKRTYDVPIYLHKMDIPTLSMAKQSADMYGLDAFEESPQPDYYIQEGDILTFEGLTFEVIFGPGHAPGHVAFYSKKDNLIINGDIMFKGGYGRVDLPGGDYNALKETITKKMFSLPDETLVYTGHGAETTIGEEKEENPILW